MMLSPAHLAARLDASRLPALAASLALLHAADTPSQIAIYAAPQPAPGAAPAAAPLVVIPLRAVAGVIDEEAICIRINTPIEGQVTGAAPAGTEAAWARISDGMGQWWADVTVSGPDGEGDLRLHHPLLLQGAFERITALVFEG